MMRIDVTRMPVTAAVRLGLLAGFLVAAGCSEPASTDKRDDPALEDVDAKVDGDLQVEVAAYERK